MKNEIKKLVIEILTGLGVGLIILILVIVAICFIAPHDPRIGV